MSMALGARPYVQLLLQSACTSMFRQIYDRNIVNCDVKRPIHITHHLVGLESFIRDAFLNKQEVVSILRF